ncbi:response regulator transcription factor [Paenibacillus spongiae]|uniref:Response regulator n=1 Tax=Paenibacillus spongiae TaxID=2909671 RepID=A0ABY5SGQ8_9BACL|nr:response regulator [Paenibacillus spongiae]UVI33167.1 response regulator [Paenibacillus spongiae]
MCKILIVDDEKFEREGVKFLIDKYNLDLEVYEADSGEKALAYMQHNPVEILFTDIRMKGMDGLQLAEQVREMKLPVKVIFMSAYGEFEYAKRAIDLKAIHYILKPVEVSEFLKVVSEVIEMVEQERKDKEEQERVQEIYGKGLRYERKIIFSQLLHGGNHDAEDEQVEPSGPAFKFTGSKPVRMMMLDTRERFFDLTGSEFDACLADLLDRPFDAVNLNECQSLLFIEVSEGESDYDLESLGNRLIQWFKETYIRDVYIVCSGHIQHVGQIRDVYNEFESILECKFFNEQGIFMFTGSALSDDGSSIDVEQLLDEIRNDVERNEYSSVRTRFERLYDSLQGGRQVSSIYLKYICMEIVKSMYGASSRKDANSFKNNVQLIYNTNKLSDLIKIMISVIDNSEFTDKNAPDSIRKVIDDVTKLIRSEYHRDLSVEEIAEKVYLSPNYLSHLFKKHSGVSIIKFITSTRMEKAKQLLTQTNKKVADISEETGYSNVAYFCTLFKTYHGKTPTQFREDLGV